MIRSSLYDYFAKLSDPRLNRNKKHNLADIIVLSILAVICGAESLDSIEEFGKARIDFLKKILYLPNGIPSHDTINRVFSILKPDKFEVVFISWVNSLRDNNIDKEVIAIPELLEMLDIKGSIVTIDAMGTQKNIAKTIIDNHSILLR
ncbi:MAG: ISAs1 family transposase [Bacteroidia bacterium]|nr:ISAs1 family transposase [Bacteroidia bacterium]